MSVVTLETMHRMQRRLDARFGDLLDWAAFSLGAMRDAVAQRAGGAIVLSPLHWEAGGYFGLTLGCTVRSRPRWLVLYEQEATADHLLVIVLHELMHIALGHSDATLSPEELQRELASLGLVPQQASAVTHALACAPRSARRLPPGGEREELEAELAAAWAVTRARRAGSLPPAGQTFTPEHVAISTFLGGIDVQ